MNVHKLPLFDTDADGKPLAEPCWVGNVQELREGNEDDFDVGDAIQAVLDGAEEAYIGGGAAPLVCLKAIPESSL